MKKDVLLYNVMTDMKLILLTNTHIMDMDNVLCTHIYSFRLKVSFHFQYTAKKKRKLYIKKFVFFATYNTWSNIMFSRIHRTIYNITVQSWQQKMVTFKDENEDKLCRKTPRMRRYALLSPHYCNHLDCFRRIEIELNFS